MKSKGMSQILALIIAATVFMMAAISIIVIFQSGMLDSTEGADRQACVSAVNSICDFNSETNQQPPSVCDDVDIPQIEGTGEDAKVSCENG